MRTNIVIDDKLMKETLRLTGLKTKREAVELGLRTVVRLRKQDEIRRFRGKLNWQGDLDAMRTDKRFWSIPVYGSTIFAARRLQRLTDWMPSLVVSLSQPATWYWPKSFKGLAVFRISIKVKSC